MILDARFIERDGKMIYQNYVCQDFDVTNGWLKFNFKKAKWVDVFSVEQKEIEGFYSGGECSFIEPCNQLT